MNAVKKSAWAQGLVIAAVAAMGAAGTARGAAITSVATGGFGDDSILMLPTGGYAVDFGSTAGSITTTGSSADAATGVTFETIGGTSAPTSTNTSSEGNVTVSIVGPNGTTGKIGSSGSYLGSGTTPTLSEAKDPTTNALWYPSQNPNANPDANFGSIVGTGNYVSSNSSHELDVTLNNLKIGQAYALQLLLVDGRSTGGTTSIFQNSTDTSPINNGTVTIHYTDGHIGGYIDATFTADAATQDFYLQTYGSSGSASGGNIQALVLAAVPEPASLGVLGVGALALVKRRRR